MPGCHLISLALALLVLLKEKKKKLKAGCGALWKGGQGDVRNTFLKCYTIINMFIWDASFCAVHGLPNQPHIYHATFFNSGLISTVKSGDFNRSLQIHGGEIMVFVNHSMF